MDSEAAAGTAELVALIGRIRTNTMHSAFRFLYLKAEFLLFVILFLFQL